MIVFPPTKRGDPVRYDQGKGGKLSKGIYQGVLPNKRFEIKVGKKIIHVLNGDLYTYEQTPRQITARERNEQDVEIPAFLQRLANDP